MNLRFISLATIKKLFSKGIRDWEPAVCVGQMEPQRSHSQRKHAGAGQSFIQLGGSGSAVMKYGHCSRYN